MAQQVHGLIALAAYRRKTQDSGVNTCKPPTPSFKTLVQADSIPSSDSCRHRAQVEFTHVPDYYTSNSRDGGACL